MPTQSGSRRPYHHGHLREALLDAAERVLEARGSAGLALRAIARQAKVTHAAAYHYFAGREALLCAVAARGFERLAEALVSGSRRASGPHGFLEMGVAYVRFAVERPALFRLMFGAEAARGRARDAALRAASDRAFEVLLGGVRARAPTADDAVVRRNAVGAWSIVHGLSALLLDGQLEVAGITIRDHERIAREVLAGPPPGQPG